MAEFPPKMNNVERKKKQPRPTQIAPLDVTQLTKTLCDANHLEKKVVIDEINIFQVEEEAEKDSLFIIMKKYFCTNRKRRRKLFIFCFIAILFFSLGFSIPHLLPASNLNKTSQSINKTQEIKASEKTVITSFGSQRVNNKTVMNDNILSDVFISVKTTQKYHHPRLVILLETWVSLVKSRTFFFTDNADEEDSFSSYGMLKGHLINTNCSSSHSRAALICKMAKEYDAFLASTVS